MKKLLTACLLTAALCAAAFAETILSEGFETGSLSGWDSNNASHWTNSTTSPITGLRSLKHVDIGASGESLIYTNAAFDLTEGTTTWRFNLKNGNWDPSGSNRFWTYLTGMTNGYVVGIDPTGTPDYVELWRIAGGSSDATLISSSLDWGSSTLTGIEVQRSPTGVWTLRTDNSGGFDNLVSAGTATDTTYTTNTQFGLFFEFTSSRAGELWMDDVLITQTTGNSAPVLGTIGDKSVIISNDLSFAVTATDVNGDDITLSASNLPPSAVFNTVTNASAVTNTFTWTTAAPTGTWETVFTANDGSNSVSETITITVTEQPDSVTFDFINDSDLNTALDGEAGPIAYTNYGLTATFSASAGKMNYTAGGDGSFGIDTLVSGEDADKFDVGEWIGITFDTSITLTNVNVSDWSPTYGDEATIYVNDTSNGVIASTGNHAFDIIVPLGQILRIEGTDGTITNNGWSLNSITVKTDTNAPPVINNAPVLDSIGNQTVIEGSPLSFSVSATDADDDDIALYATDLPSGAEFTTVTNAGAVSNTFTWASADAGTYTPIFTADDGTTNVSETITITVHEQPLLLISEIADPAGIGAHIYRFVELYNAGTNSIDLAADGWHLSRQDNGSAWNDVALTGSIGPTGTYVIANTTSNFLAAYGFDPDLADADVVDGNGRDAYFLFFGDAHTNGILIDIYGELDTDGVDSNGVKAAWYYEDDRAERNNPVLEPTNTWTASDWTITSYATTNEFSPGIHGPTPEFIPALEDQEVILGDSLYMTVTATNGIYTNDVITLSADVLPAGATFQETIGTGTVSSALSWTPASTGYYTVTFAAAGVIDTTYESITVHVVSAEPPEIGLTIPVGGPITLAWPTNAGSAFNVLTNEDLVNGIWGDANLTPFMDGDSYKATNTIGSEPVLFYKLESE